VVVEIVRGLGLGGTESLLASRLRYELSAGTKRTSRVINTHSPDAFFAEAVTASGVTLDDLATASRWTSALRLWRIASRLSPDEAVAVHSPWPAAVLKLRRALGLRGPRLVEVAHSTSYARATMLLGRLLNRHADLCIAVSAEVAAAPTTRGFRRVTVVHAGVDRERMREWIVANDDAPARYRRELGIASSARLAVSVGNLFADKRHSLLIRAVPRLPKDVHAVIVGDGPELAELTELAATLGVADRVHLLGRRPEGWTWMAVADVVAHPSAREGLPIALTEARVLGLPVVAFDVGGVSAVLGDAADAVVLDASSSAGFADAVADVVGAAPSASHVFHARASAPSSWDVSRFAEEFYEQVG
jgi:glycosyltransferase involved in cell wall biosynthesis